MLKSYVSVFIPNIMNRYDGVDRECNIYTLLLHHKYGLTVPGGQIEKDESPKEAAVRELFEEVGLKVNLDDLYLFDFSIDSDDNNSKFALYTFVLNQYVASKDLYNKEPDKHYALINDATIEEIINDYKHHEFSKSLQILLEKEHLIDFKFLQELQDV